MGLGSSFVGRREVMRQLASLIDDEQLITITGTGGIGKTRLARQIAASFEASGGCAAFVELAPATPDDDLDLTVARELGHGSIDTFVVGLDGQKALVVLDNCEHVLAQASTLAGSLMAHDNVRVLATSRSPLASQAEYVVRLGPLRASADAGDESAPAFELFLDRATAAGAAWLDVPDQRAAAAEIARRLDGVPLAIELAAARTRVLGPTDLLALLPRQLDLLDGRSGATAGRAGGVRDVVGASYEPLDDECRRAFRALSLIPHGVDLELANALAGEDDPMVTLDLLGRLVDHSLVHTVPGATGELVYRILEPVRAFGLEKLEAAGEANEVGDRYVDAVCRFAHEIVVATATSFSAELLDQIAQRYVHLLHAVEIALELDEGPARAYQLLLPMYAPTKAPRREQAKLAARVRERWPDHPDRFRAAAYAIMGHVALWAGSEDPSPLAHEALADPSATRIARIIAYRVLAFDANHGGDRDLARAHVESALEIAASRGGSFERELKMSWASLVDDPGRVSDAIETAEQMSQFAATSGEAVTVVWASSVCVHQHLRRGEVAAARVAAERGATFATRAGSPWPRASAERALAFVCTAEGRWDAALRHFGTALGSVVGAGDVEGITYTMRSAAICAQHCGRVATARALWTAVPTPHRAPSLPPLFGDAESELRDELGDPVPCSIAEAVRVARHSFEGEASIGEDVPQEPNSAAVDRQVYSFDGYELDPGRRELRHGENVVHIEPQVFDVLLRLIEDAGTLVTKERLMDDVWGSRFVSASAVTSRVKSARAATGDDGKTQKVIRTLHGRGFMFVAELDERPTQGAGRSEVASDQ